MDELKLVKQMVGKWRKGKRSKNYATIVGIDTQADLVKMSDLGSSNRTYFNPGYYITIKAYIQDLSRKKK